MKSRSGPTRKSIAAALGLAPSSITKYAGLGMPVHSLEAAREWRAKHTKPTSHAMQNKRGPSAPAHQADALTALRHAEELSITALHALQRGQSELIAPGLRAALDLVPASHRAMLRMPLEVWEMLTAAVHPVIDADCTSLRDGGAQVDFAALGAFWYRCATGEFLVTTSVQGGSGGQLDAD